jgi:hypothetical protein
MANSQSGGERSWVPITVAIISTLGVIIAAIISSRTPPPLSQPSPSLQPHSTSTVVTPTEMPLSLEEQLRRVNIILALDEQTAEEVRQQLNDGHSGYIVLANNCLDVLQQRRLKDPIALTDINSAYKVQIGRLPNASLDFAEYNDLTKYPAAIFQVWKERHGSASAKNSSLTNFDQIVQAQTP